MPRRKSSLKRKRADKTRHLRNIRIKRQLKKTLKKFHELVSAKSANEAKEYLKKVYSQLDKAAKKGILRTNTARRRKSRLTKRLRKTT
ncbi:30S ribosomal protein S20 [Candidatus Omnitrophota bacterium]